MRMQKIRSFMYSFNLQTFYSFLAIRNLLQKRFKKFMKRLVNEGLTITKWLHNIASRPQSNQ